jgi:EAL domain-containing protein (putative c-di-GMP-specific phosphodiesterase class I)
MYLLASKHYRRMIARCRRGRGLELARSFGQMTVAEGVEDARTLERLRELEVDYVQGYYLGRPELVEVA